MKSLRMFTVSLLVLVLAGMAAAQPQTSFALLVSPREASLRHAEGIQFEAQVFAMNGLARHDLEYKWSVEPDSLGRITEDGFFIAGGNDGEATIVCSVEMGLVNVRLAGRAKVIIGEQHSQRVQVIVAPRNAVVPPGTTQQYHFTFVTANNLPVLNFHAKWVVEPRSLGEIKSDGLFTAGPNVGQGYVIAFVEIDGALFRGLARVTVAEAPTGIISGQVVDAQTLLPISPAGVWAERIGSNIEWRVDAKVDSLGNFVLRHLIPGLYVVKADARKYLHEFYNNVSHFDEATPVQVAENDSISGIGFTLSKGGTIAGFVGADSDSGAIAGAHVIAIHTTQPRRSRHAVTDENGAYEITTLKTGTYAVAAEAPGYIREYYDDKDDLISADLISIIEPDSVGGIDMYLATGSAISGNVSDNNGEPLARAVVRVLALISNRPRYFREVRTDENGDYLVSVPPGFYLVQASARGYLSEFYDDAREYQDATPVQVFENQHTTNIDFVLNPLAAISGKVVEAVTNKPLRAVVTAFPEPHRAFDPTRPAIEARYPFVAKTDSLGNYVIENVKPGKYYVRAEAEGYLPEFWQEAASLSEADTVVVTESAGATGIDFTLERGGVISGTVYTAKDSTELQGAVLQVWSSTGNAIRRAVTDENGDYRLGGLRTGDYYVFAKAQGYEGQFYDGASDRSNATLVHVDAGSETDSIDFYLEKFESRLGSISGVVSSDSTGNPIPHAFVLAVPVIPPGQARFDLSDQFGFYRLNRLLPGSYVVVAWAPGYVGEFYDDVTNWREATLVNVVSNTETGDIDFGLTPTPKGPYRVSGRLRRAASNNGVANAVIYAMTTEGEVASTVTNADGSYALDELAAGTYKIMATSPNSPTTFFGGGSFETAAEVTLQNGQSAEGVEIVESATGVDGLDNAIPGVFALEQNYPNPFNPETTIKYQLAAKSEVSLRVFNLLGQEVATLVNATQEAGVYRVQWNGTNRFGQKVATGIYLFQLEAGDFNMTRKMVMMK
jgi:hypothetical protein